MRFHPSVDGRFGRIAQLCLVTGVARDGKGISNFEGNKSNKISKDQK